MKKAQILFVLLVLNSIVFCQQNFGITIDGGMSKVSSSLVFNNSTWDVKFLPSGNAGIFYTKILGKKSIIGTELLFMQIESKILTEMDIIGPNETIIGHASSNLTENLSYIGIPLYYGFRFKGITLQIGLQGSIFLKGTAKSKNHATLNGEEQYNENIYDDLAFAFYDFGPKASFLYKITDKLLVTASYYYGIKNIGKENFLDDINKIQQVTLGLKYIIINK